MLTLIYGAGTIVALITFLVAMKSIAYTLPERLMLFSVGILPLGKLIYFPIPGLYGLKVTFLVASLIGLLWLVRPGLNPRASKLLILICIVGLSFGWLENPSWLWLYQYVEKAGFDAGQVTGTTDSVVLRVLAFAFLILYCGSVSTAITRRPELLTIISRYFVVGTLAACIIGVVIFFGIWFGSLSVDDLAPISVDSHVIENEGSFYRFNPGANVNEFSMIIAFSLFLLVFVKWRTWIIIAISLFLFLCELAALTRSSWIGIALGLTIAVFLGSNNRKHVYTLIAAYSISLFVIFIAYYSFSDISNLIDTRLALEIGVSGDERIIKFNYVIDRLSNETFRMLFGFGWATNLYVHSVLFQLLYEIGVVGTLIFFAIVAYFLRGLFATPAGTYKVATISAIIFIFVSAMMQHTLYHTQTWFIIGIVSGYITISKRPNYFRIKSYL